MTFEDADNALTEASPIPGAHFGWEVRVDLSALPPAAVRDALVRIYKRDGLILFRNQSLNMDQQLDVCEIFGPVLRGALDNYIVSNVAEGGLLGHRELDFHNDVPFVPIPFRGGSLHALEVAPGVAPTRFASGFRAWEQLSPTLKARIENRNALFVRERVSGRRNRLVDLEPGDIGSVHPAVGRQQGSERPYLFVTTLMTTSIIGLAEAESDSLLDELQAVLYAPENVYEHHWTNGDFIVWDNLAVQHARTQLGPGTRTLQRVTLAEIGYWDQYPADLSLYQELQDR
jgi:taurine dioxygenase